MKKVLLNGFIGDKYGKVWDIKANNIKDIFSCIEVNYPSFKRDMLEFAENGGDISIKYGDINVDSEEELLYTIGADTVVITPLPAGGKSGGAKLLLAALMVAAFFIPPVGAALTTTAVTGTTVTTTAGVTTVAATTATTLNTYGLIYAATATSLALSGISQMMAPDPTVDSVEANDEYLFDGAQNTIAQNNVVPVLLGEMIVGGVLISSATLAGSTSFNPYVGDVTYVSTSGNLGSTTDTGTNGGGGGGGNNFGNEYPGGVEEFDTLERYIA